MANGADDFTFNLDDSVHEIDRQYRKHLEEKHSMIVDGMMKDVKFYLGEVCKGTGLPDDYLYGKIEEDLRQSLLENLEDNDI